MSLVRQRGDTIIEVIFAVTVFSMVAVGGMGLMNQGAAMAQRSLEIGMVRDQMDAQADALRYIHSEYLADLGQPTTTTLSNAATLWGQVTANAVGVTNTPTFDSISDGKTCHLPANAQPFALDLQKFATNANPMLATTATTTGNNDPIVPVLASNASVPSLADETTYAQVRYVSTGTVSQGLWIVAVKNPHTTDAIGSYDFNVYSCWLTPGQAAPVTLGTVVRLYDPKI
jgi:hypothetical protein